jgi:hypothetical protein
VASIEHAFHLNIGVYQHPLKAEPCTLQTENPRWNCLSSSGTSPVWTIILFRVRSSSAAPSLHDPTPPLAPALGQNETIQSTTRSET